MNGSRLGPIYGQISGLLSESFSQSTAQLNCMWTERKKPRQNAKPARIADAKSSRTYLKQMFVNLEVPALTLR